MSASQNAPDHEVSYLAQVRERLTAWKALAIRLGRANEFAAAIREMEDRLHTDPRDWGDPVRELRGMDATFFRRVGPVLIVTYAVHNARPVVFVQQVRLTPGSPMQDAEHDPPIV